MHLLKSITERLFVTTIALSLQFFSQILQLIHPTLQLSFTTFPFSFEEQVTKCFLLKGTSDITFLGQILMQALHEVQLFLLTKYENNHPSRNFLHSIGSKLINDRLPIFKSITKNLSDDKIDNSKIKCENLFESTKDDLPEIKMERKYSQSTFSNTSYEEDKKCNALNFLSNENNF